MAFILGLIMMNIVKAVPTQLIIDTDMDIDDVSALIYVMRRPKAFIDLRLITVTGNSWAYLSSGVTNLFNLLHSLGRDDVDVGVGYSYAWRDANTTHGCSQLSAIPNGGAMSWGAGNGRYEISMLYGSATELPQSPRQWRTSDEGAVAKMKRAIDAVSLSQKVTLLSLGGLTTFATYLRMYPEDSARIERLYIMGGAVNHTGNLFTVPTNPYAEFNIYIDPDAASYVVNLSRQVPVYLVPLDVTNSVPYADDTWTKFTDPKYTPAWLATLWLRCRQAMNISDNQTFYQTIFPWDEFATALVSDPEVLAATTFIPNKISVVTSDGSQLGRTLYDPLSGSNIYVGIQTSATVFWNSWFTTMKPSEAPKVSSSENNLSGLSIAVIVICGLVVFSVCLALYISRSPGGPRDLIRRVSTMYTAFK